VLPQGHGLQKRGQTARVFFFAAVLIVAGCANPPKGELSLSPAPQRQATHQVVGEAIVASLAGASVTVRWLTPVEVEQYFENKPGLVYPWPKEVRKAAPPTTFLLRVRNQTSGEVQFDPTLVFLVSQDGRRMRPVSYEELYEQLEGTEDSAARLRSLQATLLSRFLVITPGGQREGLLVFPALGPEDKHLLLELGSFFVGGRDVLGLFEFQVVRQKKE